MPAVQRLVEIDGVLHQRCSCCHEYKLANDSEFAVNRSSPNGLHWYCKGCDKQKAKRSHKKRVDPRAEEKAQRRLEKQDARLQRLKELEAMRLENRIRRQEARQLVRLDATKKRCRKCREIYPLDNIHYYKSKKTADGHMDTCRMCAEVAYHGKEYRAQAMLNLAIRKDPVASAKKEAARRERARVQDREKGRRYRQSAKGKHAQQVSTQKKRARKNELPNTLTKDEWQYALEHFGYKCAVCGRSVDLWHTLAMDHWMPVAYQGEDNPGTVATNIVPLCHSQKGAAGDVGCNNLKGNTLPHDWLVGRYGERKARQIEKRIEAYFSHVREMEQAS